MNVRRTFRTTLVFCLAAALPSVALWQIAHAAAPAHGAAAKQAQPLRALSARLHALLQPAPAVTGPAVAYSASFHLSDFLAPKYSVAFHAGADLLKPRAVRPATASNPVTLQPYSATEVIHITGNNASPLTGTPLRSPASAAATDPIAPNKPVTFVVRVNNTDPTVTTQATDVYLQFKDPDSRYQDTNLSGPSREHKVFTKDPFTYAHSNNQYDSGAAFIDNYFPADAARNTLPGYQGSSDVFGNFTFGKVTGGTAQNPTTDPNTIPGYAQSPGQTGGAESQLLVNTSSATSLLFNGGNGEAGQVFTDANTHARYFRSQRGVIGGGTNGNFITVGRADTSIGNNGQPNSPNPVDVDTTVGTATVHIPIPGPDPATFSTQGQEYECQYLNAHDNTASSAGSPSGFPTAGSDAVNADYGDPYYLAGNDDLNGVLPVRPEWLRLHRLSNNPASDSYNLYAGTWASPLSPSDFYLDAIVYDTPGAAGSTATANPVPMANRFRIYDNVWGFSTQYFDPAPLGGTHTAGTKDILVVSDNALGQKFSASALNGGFVNLRPIFYGAESYFTDIDITLLPNALHFWIQPSGKKPTFNAPVMPATGTQTNTADNTDQFPQQQVTALDTSFAQIPENGLGYQSYNDFGVISDTATHRGEQVVNVINGSNGNFVSVPKSQAYSLWRILSRGRVTPAVYAAYEPTFATQPAVSDPATGFTAPVADGVTSPKVPVATRCVLWVSPFTADQPIDQSGSISDTSVQTDIAAYVALGGRLLVSGQEVASGLTQNGAANNGPNSFLAKTLNVVLASPGTSVDNQTLTGAAGLGHPIAGDAFFDFQAPPVFNSAYSDFYNIVPSSMTPFVYTAPASTSPLVVGNNYIGLLGSQDKWRTDSALTQLGPVVATLGQSQVQGQINTVTPQNGALTDFTVGGGASLVYHNDITDAPGSGFGSRVIFSSVGLEGLGTEFYTAAANGVNFYFPRNDRPNVLHNVVNYLRTGAYEGRVFLGSSTSVGVPDAIVYLKPFRNTLPGTRQTYSSYTSDGSGVHPDGTPDVDASGNPNPTGYYHMDGVEPGNYIAVSYKQGFSETTSPTNFTNGLSYTTAGDTTVTNINLNIVPLPNGTVSGNVTLSTGGPAMGATVTFTPVGGGAPQTATTDGSGNYTASLPTGNYTVVATTTTPSATSPTPGPTVTVMTNTATTGVNLVLAVNPGHLSGQVALTGVTPTTTATATVTFTAGTTTATTTVALTGTTPGAFTSPSLAPGSYTITASAPTYVATNTDTQTVTAGATTPVTPTITLRAANSLTLTGRVFDTASNGGLPGATVTVKDPSGTTVATAAAGGGGLYSTTLLEGTYTITASAVSYITASLPPVTLTTTNDPAQNIGLAHAPPLNSGSNAYTAGRYNLVSYPYEYDAGGNTPFDAIFGSEITASNLGGNRGPALIYSASVNNYLAEPTAPADGVHLGRGYFVYLKSVAGVFSPLLGAPPANPTVTVPLQSGWNMIGVPCQANVSASRLQIQFANGTTVSLASAASSTYNAVLPNVYGFNAGSGPSGAYYTVGSGGQLQPYQGYWLYAKLSGLSIVVPTSGG